MYIACVLYRPLRVASVAPLRRSKKKDGKKDGKERRGKERREAQTVQWAHKQASQASFSCGWGKSRRVMLVNRSTDLAGSCAARPAHTYLPIDFIVSVDFYR